MTRTEIERLLDRTLPELSSAELDRARVHLEHKLAKRWISPLKRDLREMLLHRVIHEQLLPRRLTGKERVMALAYTIKATQTDGKPVVLVYENDNEALQSVAGLVMADHICEVHVFIRHSAVSLGDQDSGSEGDGVDADDKPATEDTAVLRAVTP